MDRTLRASRSPAHRPSSVAARPRFAVFTALALMLPLATGCHFPVSQEVMYRKAGDEYPPPDAPEPAPLRAPAKNDLIVGIQKFRLAQGTREELREAGDLTKIANDFREALLDARIFKEVVYPVRDEKVDVELEPIVKLGLTKNRLTNFVKLFPGIIFPWIDGFGFDYDHVYTLEIHVRNAQSPEVVCDAFTEEGELTAERYPSIFWFAGLHASIFVLLIFETVTTDHAVAQQLAEKDAQMVGRDAIAWLIKEFSTTARACPNHPDRKQKSGRFCGACGSDLNYPILNRVNGKAAKPGAAKPAAPAAGGGGESGSTGETGTGPVKPVSTSPGGAEK